MKDLGLIAATPFILLIFFLDRIALVFFPFTTGLSLSKWWFHEREMLKSIWRIVIFVLILTFIDLIRAIIEGQISF